MVKGSKDVQAPPPPPTGTDLLIDPAVYSLLQSSCKQQLLSLKLKKKKKSSRLWTPVCPYRAKMSHLMTLWYFSSSVNSFFKNTCAASQWGLMSDFWSYLSSTSILYVCEQRRLWRDCANAQARLSLRWSPM